MNPIYCILLCFVFLSKVAVSQEHGKIGLVLSGGGATGLAHIGVLKALEEREIRIDYITGTSAGALVGSFYACGYSPEQIEYFAKSESFQIMTRGELEVNQRFSHREPENTASMFQFGLRLDSLIQNSLPTNLISSVYMDYFMMTQLGLVSASYNNDFDSLFVPFRCVASDIVNKRSVVFSEGNLNECVRASMSYPFFLSPTRIDGVLLFDGGLYNNFPANVMYHDFNPDFIIGSNVSSNAELPTETNLMSQITNMLVSYTNFSLPCEEGFILEPKTDVTTFDFDGVSKAIDDGYRFAVNYLDSLEAAGVKFQKISREELATRRARFQERVSILKIDGINLTNLGKRKLSFVKNSLIRTRKKEIIDRETLESRYFHIAAAEQVEEIFPTLKKKSDSTYTLDLKIQKAKPFVMQLGGHVSSRPVNTGFFGISYRDIGKTIWNADANVYFGKFYGSAKAVIGVETPTIFPISVKGYFVMNRWDYFRSFATFFEDVKPSFLVENEMYAGGRISIPLFNNSTSAIDAKYFKLDNSYYQSDNFSNLDTTDRTVFEGVSGYFEIKQNSLNRKQFASSGHFARLKARYVYGQEHTYTGSTAPTPINDYKYHSWINLTGEIQSFIIDQPAFHFGLHGLATFNSQSLFKTYTATVLNMSTFAPIPDVETFFLREYRSPQFVGLGGNLIFSFKRKLDFRIDGYFYQPFVQLVRADDGTYGYSKPFKGETFLASSSLIYNSFLGPIRATVNYFPKQTQPLSFQISFGYVLFNERAIR